VIDYAVKATVLLGAHRGQYLSSVEIADHYGMSPKMLGQVLRSLGAAGILVARQGWHGGFSLARPAEAIPLRSVIAAVGSGESPRPQPGPPRYDDIARSNGSSRHNDAAEAVDDFWHSLDVQVQATLEAMTIGDLLTKVATT
jgi:Rrf2 family protein